MWCLADHTHSELLYKKNEEKSDGGREVTGATVVLKLFMFMSSMKKKQPRQKCCILSI